MKAMIKSVLSFLFVALSLQGFAQVESIKVMSYNLMWYKTSSAPCTHSVGSLQRDNDLKNIVAYAAPDLLVVNEFGAIGSNPLVVLRDVLNVDGISHFSRAGSNFGGSSSIANMMFFNNNKLVLDFQDAVTFDLNNIPLIRPVDYYRLYVKDAALGQPGVDTTFIGIFVAHLKAGNGRAEKAERAKATAAVMSYIDSNVTIDNLLFAGDLNVYTSSESAFQNLVNHSSNPNRSFNDPENQLGSWNNNSNFANVHTQSTHSSSSGCFSGGGMDDRFDFILSSDAIVNNTHKLSFTNYYGLGQDGTFFNGSISSNNISVPSYISSALYNFSDHLPVIIELEASVSGIGTNSYESMRNSWSFVNPARDNIELSLKGRLSEEALDISILDLSGKVVRQLKCRARHNLSIDCSNWPQGVYLISLSNGKDFRESRKVFVP
tara:strand:+ start:3524 stop:4825 length:1302 start_codon:yes stop_codon:yes gene_type:complete